MSKKAIEYKQAIMATRAKLSDGWVLLGKPSGYVAPEDWKEKLTDAERESMGKGLDDFVQGGCDAAAFIMNEMTSQEQDEFMDRYIKNVSKQDTRQIVEGIRAKDKLMGDPLWRLHNDEK